MYLRTNSKQYINLNLSQDNFSRNVTCVTSFILWANSERHTLLTMSPSKLVLMGYYSRSAWKTLFVG
jgi:hypothetical protein